MGLITLLDYLPAPFPVVQVDRPPIYETLRDRPETGTLLELPVGIRDSFTSRGFLDHRALAYQIIHRRPIVGGVVSRMSPSIVAGLRRRSADRRPARAYRAGRTRRGRCRSGRPPLLSSRKTASHSSW